MSRERISLESEVVSELKEVSKWAGVQPSEVAGSMMSLLKPLVGKFSTKLGISREEAWKLIFHTQKNRNFDIMQLLDLLIQEEAGVRFAALVSPEPTTPPEKPIYLYTPKSYPDLAVEEVEELEGDAIAEVKTAPFVSIDEVEEDEEYDEELMGIDVPL